MGGRSQPTEIGLGTSGTNSSTVGLTYNYGTTSNNGNLQSVSYAGGGLSYTQTFGYDELNRLTTSVESGSWSQTNSYDRYGNRTRVGSGLSFSATNNRITNAGYVYDAVGNLTNDSTQSFAFDAENKVKTVNGEADVYRYDGDGNRVRKNFTSGEKVRMVYRAGQLIAEYDLSNGSLKKEYVYGAKGLLATIEPANGTRYTTADHLGTPRVVTNSSAGVVSRHDYMPFGEEIGTGFAGRTTGMGFSVVDGLRQKFTSKERDNETGLDYFGARYLATNHGRFTSADPLLSSGSIYDPQTWNRYSYTLNNPLKYIDPTGMFVWDTSLGGSADDKDVSGKIRDKRKQIRAAIAKANQALNSGKLDSTQKANLERALKAYGAEGTANGVKLAVGKVKEGAAAETDSTQPYVLYDQKTGDFSANVTVTFKEGGSVDAEAFAHEGSHVADRQALVAAFAKASIGDPSADWLYMPENLKVRQTESGAYRVSAAVAQGLGHSLNPGGYEIWNTGWRAADRSANMQRGIKELLTKSPLYKDKLNERLVRTK